MIKLLWALATLFIFHAPAFAGSTQIDFETFSQLPFEEQKNVMKMLQTFMVLSEETQIEENPLIEVEVKETSDFDAFLHYMKNANFFIQSAYAKRSKRVYNYGDYSSIRDDAGEEGSPHFFDRGDRKFLCMYGGWFSYVTSETGTIDVLEPDPKNPEQFKEKKLYRQNKGSCVHPSSTTLTNPKDWRMVQEAKDASFQNKVFDTSNLYSELSNKDNANIRFTRFVPEQDWKKKKLGIAPDIIKSEHSDKVANQCRKADSIICNPEIFGQAPDGSYFCVQGNAFSRNTSFLCAQAVASYSEADQDKIFGKMILENLGGGSEKKRRFTDSLLSMYDVCMCQGKTGYLAFRYSKKIFRDRTCYGLLLQSKEILKRISRSTNCRAPLQDLRYNELANLAAWADAAYLSLDKTFKMFENEEGNVRFNLSNKDDSKFELLRMENLKEYERLRECPLRVEPSFKIKSLGEAIIGDKVYEKFEGFLLGAYGAKPTVSEVVRPDGKSCILGSANGDPAHIFYCEKYLEGEYMIHALATVKGKSMLNNKSNELPVPPLDYTPRISIERTEVDYKTRKAKFKATVKTAKGDDLPKGAQYSISWIPKDKKGSITASPEDMHIGIADIFDFEYQIAATLLVPDKDPKESNPGDVPKIEPGTCQIELAQETDVKKEKVIYKLSVIPKEGQENQPYEVKWNLDPVSSTQSEGDSTVAEFKVPNPPPPKAETKAEEKVEEKAEERTPAEEKPEESPTPEYNRPKTITASVTIKGVSKPLECSAEIPAAPELPAPPPKPEPPAPEPEPEPEPDKYAIVIKTIVDEKNFEVLKADITKNGEAIELSEELSVSWFVEGSGRNVASKESESSEDGIKKIEDDDDVAVRGSAEAPEGYSAAGSGEKTQIGRLTVDQDAFAILTDPEGNEIASNHLTIEKIVIPKEIPVGKPNFRQPGPMPPMLPKPFMRAGGVN